MQPSTSSHLSLNSPSSTLREGCPIQDVEDVIFIITFSLIDIFDKVVQSNKNSTLGKGVDTCAPSTCRSRAKLPPEKKTQIDWRWAPYPGLSSEDSVQHKCFVQPVLSINHIEEWVRVQLTLTTRVVAPHGTLCMPIDQRKGGRGRGGALNGTPSVTGLQAHLDPSQRLIGGSIRPGRRLSCTLPHLSVGGWNHHIWAVCLEGHWQELAAYPN